jgi:DNA mismatch repair protein MutS2
MFFFFHLSRCFFPPLYLWQRMSNAQMSGMPTLYLLHGHGTGALKKGLRTWLRTSMGGRIRSWRAGTEADGGDAFTVVELK